MTYEGGILRSEPRGRVTSSRRAVEGWMKSTRIGPTRASGARHLTRKTDAWPAPQISKSASPEAQRARPHQAVSGTARAQPRRPILGRPWPPRRVLVVAETPPVLR